MRRKRVVEICLMLVSVFFTAPCHSGGSWPVAVYTTSSDNSADIPYGKLRRIIYVCLLPDAEGTIVPVENPAHLADVIWRAHLQDVKVDITVMGTAGGVGENFEIIAADPVRRAVFVQNVLDYVKQYNLDGVDIDWEYPTAGQSSANCGLLIHDLAAALHHENKSLSMAVFRWGTYADAIPDSVLSDVDCLNVMIYGQIPEAMLYDTFYGSMQYWFGRGLAPHKAMLGLPFYGNNDTRQTRRYSSIVSLDPEAPYRDRSIDGFNYNGIGTIRNKINLARANGCGVMVWRLGLDTWDNTSLTAAIDSTLKEFPSYNGPYFIDPATITAYASSEFAPGGQVCRALAAVNLSGLEGLTGNNFPASWDPVHWISADEDTARWIVMDLGKTYSLDYMKVWNLNRPGTTWLGCGARTISIYVSGAASPGNPVNNPGNWVYLKDAELNKATGTAIYDSPDRISLDNVGARYVSFRCVPFWTSRSNVGLSEVQFYKVDPLVLQGFRPADEAKDVSVSQTRLTWSWQGQGVPNPQYRVYFGRNFNLVSGRNPSVLVSRQAGTVYPSVGYLGLDYSTADYPKSYYWKIVLVDGDASQQIWESPTRSFTTCKVGISPAIFSEVDFESGFGQWVNTAGDTHDWQRNSGSTPTGSTGPAGGDGSNWYAYLETSAGYANSSGDIAILESPAFGGSNRTLTFSYHMYGSNMGTLNVDVYSNGVWNRGIWSRVGQQHTSGSEPFKRATVPLGIYSGLIRIRFGGVAAGGSLGDMAIDNIEVSGIPEDMCLDRPAADISGPAGVPDCKVDIHDFVRLVEQWLACGRYPASACN